ncbi:MAG: CoA ester lyase [Armatimonadetes bacterium]|nr:CoA ester lyase [Armatimonadota bacterium]
MFNRSWLFMPGNREKMLDKSLTIEADAVVWDLEDGVPQADKRAARELIRLKLDALPLMAQSGESSLLPQFYVRINGVTAGMIEEDLKAAVNVNLSGIMMPKVESPDEVRLVARTLAAFEKERNVPEGRIKIIVTFETALGIIRAFEIASASDRVSGLCFGAEDYTLDLGTSRSREGSELFYARSAVVTAAAAVKAQVIDTVFSDLNDEEGLSQECARVRQLGFTGKCAIHPRQLPVINRMFSPSERELEYARKVVEAYDRAQEAGIGVITVDGKMVDPPVVERSRQLLKRFPKS